MLYYYIYKIIKIVILLVSINSWFNNSGANKVISQ